MHETNSGVTLGAETGFILARDPDTVRAPRRRVRLERTRGRRRHDVWLLAGRRAGSGDRGRLAGRRPPYLRAKALNWLDAGAIAVLVLDPRSQSATVYRTGENIGTFTDGDLDLSDAVPGWRVAVADFFAY